jgi:HrpA-like RNA helicase
MPLPIDPYREQLVGAIKRERFLLVVGETGSGKTTQIPQYILPFFQRIAISQPRRVAAISVSTRVAEELQSSVGGELVGYKIRFHDKTQSKTRLNFMTDGILLRECLVDPQLTAYDCVIIDEAHERSLVSSCFFFCSFMTNHINSTIGN